MDERAGEKQAGDDLAGKVAIVTGASRGIGAAVAEELAGRGVKVMLAARSADAVRTLAAAIRERGGEAQDSVCDVTNYDAVETTVAATVAAFGRLDILVNNAGVIEPIARLADSDPAAWATTIDINVKGVYHGLRAALPVMADQGSGVVVNISSGAATNPLEGWSHYCAGKAAALMLTRAADLEHRDHGIRVVGLSPGTVATEMQVQIKASGINAVSQLDPAVHIPPQWAARAVAWLCTAEGAEFAGRDLVLRDADNRRRIGLQT